MRLSFRDRIALGIIASGLTLAMFAPKCDPETKVEPKPASRHVGIVVVEDDEGWDCRAMGNRICGSDLEGRR